MSRRKLPRDEDVLTALRASIAESHYGYAPGLASFEGVFSTLCIGGAARRDDRAAAAVRDALRRLEQDGVIEKVEVVGPGGITSRDWYRWPAEAAS